jgi:hypothetical protein
MTDTLPTLTICGQGHTAHYPADLEDAAIESDADLGFCLTCLCGTVVFAIAWAGDRVRVMETGDMGLYADFEATRWREGNYGNPTIDDGCSSSQGTG